MTSRSKKSVPANPTPPALEAEPESLTGQFTVFTGEDGVIAVARLLDLAEGCEWTYRYETLFAVTRRGALRFDPEHVVADSNAPDEMDPEAMLMTFRTFTQAFIYAHGLLSEGNRWQAAA